MRKICASAIGLCACAPMAFGQITAFNFTDVDNSAGGASLNGFNTTDISIDFERRWTGSQMLIELTQGSIYQNPIGGNGPSQAFASLFDPAVPFDTFVTLNALTSEELPDQVEVFGGAVNLGGAPELQFDESGINAAWVYFPPFPFPEDYFPNFQDQNDFLISRVTLSDDAEGTFTVLASAGDRISVSTFPPAAISAPDYFAERLASLNPSDELALTGTIEGGAFVPIPEPAVGAMLLGLSALNLRRRAS